MANRIVRAGNRHLSTTITTADGPTKISSTRDVTNRIVARTVTVNSAETASTRYAHAAAAELSALVVDAQGAITEYTVSLPGGAAVRFVLGSESREQWTYPNLHGSINKTDLTGKALDPEGEAGIFGYSYDAEWLIGSASRYGSVQAAMSVFATNPTAIFPFPVSGCTAFTQGASGERLTVGDGCAIHGDLG